MTLNIFLDVKSISNMSDNSKDKIFINIQNISAERTISASSKLFNNSERNNEFFLEIVYNIFYIIYRFN